MHEYESHRTGRCAKFMNSVFAVASNEHFVHVLLVIQVIDIYIYCLMRCREETKGHRVGHSILLKHRRSTLMSVAYIIFALHWNRMHTFRATVLSVACMRISLS